MNYISVFKSLSTYKQLFLRVSATVAGQHQISADIVRLFVGTIMPAVGTIAPPVGTIMPAVGTIIPPTGAAYMYQSAAIGTITPPIGSKAPPVCRLFASSLDATTASLSIIQPPNCDQSHTQINTVTTSPHFSLGIWNYPMVDLTKTLAAIINCNADK